MPSGYTEGQKKYLQAKASPVCQYFSYFDGMSPEKLGGAAI